MKNKLQFLVAVMMLLVGLLTQVEAQSNENEVKFLTPWSDNVEGDTLTLVPGSNRLLIYLGLASNKPEPALQSVTYGGQSMIKIADQLQGASFKSYVSAYYLDEAGISNTTSNVFSPVWATGLANTPKCMYVLLENVDQEFPIYDFATIGATTTDEPVSTRDLYAPEDGGLAIIAACSGNRTSTFDFKIDNEFSTVKDYIAENCRWVVGQKDITNGIDIGVQVTHNIGAGNRIALLGLVVAKNISTGVNELYEETKFEMRKTQNELIIVGENLYNGKELTFDVCDITGRIIKTKSIIGLGQFEMKFNLRNITNGMYFVRLRNEKNNILKFIK